MVPSHVVAVHPISAANVSAACTTTTQPANRSDSDAHTASQLHGVVLPCVASQCGAFPIKTTPACHMPPDLSSGAQTTAQLSIPMASIQILPRHEVARPAIATASAVSTRGPVLGPQAAMPPTCASVPAHMQPIGLHAVVPAAPARASDVVVQHADARPMPIASGSVLPAVALGTDARLGTVCAPVASTPAAAALSIQTAHITVNFSDAPMATASSITATAGNVAGAVASSVTTYLPLPTTTVTAIPTNTSASCTGVQLVTPHTSTLPATTVATVPVGVGTCESGPHIEAQKHQY